jgi:DNA-directed RNA polymerase specialized sigma subunit
MEEKDTLDLAYGDYATDPSVDNLNRVVTQLKPTIDYQLASLGSTNDPVMRNKALVFAAQAIPAFDPQRSTLPTYVSSQLRRLSRERRARSTPMRIPERAQLDAYAISKQEQEFIDTHGREPDMIELSDFSGIGLSTLEKIRDTVLASPTEDALGEQNEHLAPDYFHEATTYVYTDSDHIDRKILELKTGHNMGKTHVPLKAKQIAAKLKISPSQVSRRSLRLSKKINEIRDALEV